MNTVNCSLSSAREIFLPRVAQSEVSDQFGSSPPPHQCSTDQFRQIFGVRESSKNLRKERGREGGEGSGPQLWE